MQKVLITGGSRGIGAACCKKFAEEGCDIIFTYNHNAEKAEAVADELKQCDVEAQAIKMDISNKVECEAVLTPLLEAQEIDVLINNAGIAKDNLFYWMETGEWEDVIQTNLNGTFYVTSLVVKQMVKNKKGSIVNLSSISGLSGNMGQTNYSAAKAGIIGFTKSLAVELARQKIRVNCVAPGFIQTDMTDDLDSNMKKIIPMRRAGKAEEVAEAVYFMASEKASYITGEVMNISGGLWR